MIMLRGATNTAYVISRMIIDFISFVVFTQIFFAMNTAFGVDTSGWQTLGILFCVAATFQHGFFNALSMAKFSFSLVLRILFFAAAYLMMSFVGAFTSSYLTSATSYKTL